MKFLLETFVAIIMILFIIYIIFSFAGGTFDFSLWEQTDRYTMATLCLVGSIGVLVVQLFRRVL